jgi:hypothetical protein
MITPWWWCIDDRGTQDIDRLWSWKSGPPGDDHLPYRRRLAEMAKRSAGNLPVAKTPRPTPGRPKCRRHSLPCSAQFPSELPSSEPSVPPGADSCGQACTDLIAKAVAITQQQQVLRRLPAGRRSAPAASEDVPAASRRRKAPRRPVATRPQARKTAGRRRSHRTRPTQLRCQIDGEVFLQIERHPRCSRVQGRDQPRQQVRCHRIDRRQAAMARATDPCPAPRPPSALLPPVPAPPVAAICSPIIVRRTSAEERSKRMTPCRCSTFLSATDRVGWLTWHFSAACPKCLSRARATI